MEKTPSDGPPARGKQQTLDMPGEYTLFVDLLVIDAQGELYVHRRPMQLFTYRETPVHHAPKRYAWVLGLPAQVEEWLAKMYARYPGFLDARMHAYHNEFENVLFWTSDYQFMRRRAAQLRKELEAAEHMQVDASAQEGAAHA